MLMFLREELTSLPKVARTAFCLPSRPPAKGCPARLRACVGVVKPCAHEAFYSWVCAWTRHFCRCNTRHGAFRSTRGRWWVRGLRALSTVPRCKHLV